MRFHKKIHSQFGEMQDNSACSWRVLSTYMGMMSVNCLFNCPITLSNYKHDTYTVLLVLKSGYW